MRSSDISAFFEHLSLKKKLPFLRENGKVIMQFIVTALFMGMGIWFLKHEKAELTEVKSTLAYAQWTWVMLGIGVTVFYMFLQGLMYLSAFHSIQCKVRFSDMVILFLKRNLISVFLPAGGVSSLAFFTGPLERKGINRTQIHYASTLYGFIGILSVIIVAVPALLYALFKGTSNVNEWIALASLLAVAGFLLHLYRLLLHKGRFYQWVLNHFPSIELLIEDISNNKALTGRFILTVLISVIIEFAGIAHVYIAMKALQVNPSLFAAVMGYIIAVIFMVVSPFLRGLGAIEVSMSIILVRFGFSNVEAISITLLYRLFEFWLPLLSGVLSFLSGINKLLLRVVPATMILLLGIINVISVLTPAIPWRLEHLREYVMLGVIHASNYYVLTAGLFLMITAAFMLKGLRSTWWIALILSIISFIGHITKAMDYEEAAVALLIVVILIFTRREYYVKSHPRLRFVGWKTAVFSIAAILVYGVTGFYLLDKKHFNIDFNLLQSVQNTLANFFLIGNSSLVPRDVFARDFLYSINTGGFLSMAFLLYTLVRPYAFKGRASEENHTTAVNLVKRFGKSAVDYFKTLPDKMIFYEASADAFIAYRIAGNYAVVLEDPVAESIENMKICISRFDTFCYENSLKSVYYRVPEDNLPVYHEKKKKSMFLGQEAIVDLESFSLEGGHFKSLRNAIHRIRDMGYKTSVHEPPVKDGTLQKLKSVSDEWLSETGRHEIIFSQGMFDWDELKKQTIISVENPEEKVIAFLNVIPDFAASEGTYDLMRKTADAPKGIMDFILIELFGYLRSKQYRFVNLGFAPMSGLNDAHTFGERSMKFAYEKIRSFSHYKGMREFKDKFGPQWHNKYLVYDYDYDLIQFPVALSHVIKP